MITRGMALQSGSAKRLKKMRAIELVRRLKRYKDAYRTFPHMTSPYVYPVGGFGLSLAKAMSHVVQANGGTCVLEQPVDAILQGGEGVCGVSIGNEEIHADYVIAAPESVPDRVEQKYQVVRLFAVLAHPPNLCKDASSCHLIIPGAHCERENDIFMVSAGPSHGVAPKGKWLVAASARVEGSADGDALAIAKRELAAVLPLLKPARKMFAEITPYCEPNDEARPDGLHIFSSCDESTYLDSVEEEVESIFERVTGERIASLRKPYG